MDFTRLNADNFKRWIKNQDEFDTTIENNLAGNNLIGASVETKFGRKKIAQHIIIENGNSTKVIKEFLENGGTLKQINGDEYLIEVSSGAFMINKRYVIV
jgi:hypothetical protein